MNNNNKYKILKCKLDQIIKNPNHLDKIIDAVDRTHGLVIHVYQFMKLWILNLYHKGTDIPVIDENIIKMAFRVLKTHHAGPIPTGYNNKIYTKFEKFYNNTYSKLNYDSKIDGVNLSSIIDYQCTDILTNIENNIKMHFCDYVKQFVNGSFKNECYKILEKYTGKQRAEMKTSLRSELNAVKRDLFDNTLASNPKYHEWINKHRSKLFPEETQAFDQSDINDKPQRYMKNMIYMNIELERIEKKMFHFFPLRTELTPKYITIDTKAIIELFIETGKKTYLDNIEGTKEDIWYAFFWMNNNVFDRKQYKFDYMIRTDGFATSLQFIHEDDLLKQQLEKERLKNGKEETKRMTQQIEELILDMGIVLLQVGMIFYKNFIED